MPDDHLTVEVLPYAQLEAPRTGIPRRPAPARCAGSDAATAAERTATLVVGHLAKENDLLLPALASADMAALLADMPAQGRRAGVSTGE